MGINISKNNLIEEDFNGDDGDYIVDASNYIPGILTPEWFVSENDIKQLKSDLKDLATVPEKVEPFTFKNHVVSAKCIKVYDGDTITIATKLPLINDDSVYRFNIRLNGIDCPEMRSKNREEKNAAIFIQQMLENLLLHKNVTLENLASEKYNRLLADVILHKDGVDINISQWLLNNNYAVKYDGGTKVTPVHWKEYMRTGKSRFKKQR